MAVLLLLSITIREEFNVMWKYITVLSKIKVRFSVF